MNIIEKVIISLKGAIDPNEKCVKVYVRRNGYPTYVYEQNGMVKNIFTPYGKNDLTDVTYAGKITPSECIQLLESTRPIYAQVKL